MPKYILIGLLVVIGTFMIMNYWPKLMEKTKNRILMLIFGAFFISIFIEEPNKAHKQIEGRQIKGAVKATKAVAT